MINPELLARWSRETQDAIAAVVELTHAADEVVYGYPALVTDAEKVEALEKLVHAIRHLTPSVSAFSKTIAQDAERDARGELRRVSE